MPRNQRAQFDREEPEQQLYMSDDEPRAEQTVEVTHEDETTKEPREVPTKTWGGKGAKTIPFPFRNYGDHVRRLRERHDTEPVGAVEEQHLRAFCARFPWVESKDKQSQKSAGTLRNPTPDRERDALCQYLHDKHRDLWQRHVVPREGSSVAGGMRFRIGDDFIQLWMAARDWDHQFPKPKKHMWFCHAIRLMARYQAYYAFGIINWWAGKNTAECRAKHRARPLPPGASADDDIAMVIFCKDCEKKSLPFHDYRLPFMRENNDDPMDDSDAAASDGEAREESNFDDGDDQRVDEDEEVPLLHDESGEPTSPTPSTRASDDDYNDNNNEDPVQPTVGTKRTRPDEELEKHPDPNVREKQSMYKAAEARRRDAEADFASASTSLQKALHDYELAEEKAKAAEAETRAVELKLCKKTRVVREDVRKQYLDVLVREQTGEDGKLRCAICGCSSSPSGSAFTPRVMVCDHRRALCLWDKKIENGKVTGYVGNPNARSNLQLICGCCDQEKTAEDMDEYWAERRAGNITALTSSDVRVV